MWFQGKDSMPELVVNCYQSWIENNSDFEIIFLDKSNLSNYVEIDPRILNNVNISIQALSDIIRINLLSQNGGVWVDATCFCLKPLVFWLNEYLATGFFAFDRPGPDRMISSWFIASNPGNYIIETWCKSVNDYWIANPTIKSEENLTEFRKTILKYIQKKYFNETSDWFSFISRKLISVYPYFYFHYLFFEGYMKNKDFKNMWDNSKKYSADIPHRLQHFGFNNPITEELKSEIDDKRIPFFKLSHKIPVQNISGSAINYLFESSKTSL